MRKLLVLSLVLTVVLAWAAPQTAQAVDYKPEYKLSTVPTSYPWGKAGERWAELVREKTQGRINIKMYPGMSLVGGDQTKEFSAIRQGSSISRSARPSTGRRRSGSSTCFRCRF